MVQALAKRCEYAYLARCKVAATLGGRAAACASLQKHLEPQTRLSHSCSLSEVCRAGIRRHLASVARAQVLTRPALFATHSTLVFRMAAADADIEQQNTALQVVRYDPLHKSRQSPCLFFTLCPAGFDEGGEEARRRAKVARVRDEDGSSHDR